MYYEDARPGPDRESNPGPLSQKTNVLTTTLHGKWRVKKNTFINLYLFINKSNLVIVFCHKNFKNYDTVFKSGFKIAG